MKKNLFMSALMVVAVGSALADTTPIYSTEGFEGYDNGAVTAHADWIAGAEDQSVIQGDVVYAGSKALSLNTEGLLLTNDLSSVTSDISDQLDDGNTVVFEAQVKFVASDTLADPYVGGATGEDSKFAIYAYSKDDNSPTNLVVYHAFFDADADEDAYTNEVFESVNITTNFTKVSVTLKDEGDDGLFFQVSINDGEPLETGIDDIYAQTFGASWLKTTQDSSDVSKKAVTAVCFKGTGFVDDLAVYAVDAGSSEEDVFNEGDEFDGEEISADVATWLNGLVGEEVTYEALAAALESRTSTINGEAVSIEDCYLLGIDPVNGSATFEVAGIEVGNGTVDITVSIDRTDAVDATSINGVLKIKGLATLGGTEYSYDQDVSAADFNDGDFSATYTITPANDEVFFKAAIETTASSVGE